MQQQPDTGITVNAAPMRGEALDASANPVAVFLGRARSGPLQRAVPVDNFADFERWFGGAWDQSTLGPSVQQFFQHGGGRALVVRIAAGARGGLLELPTAAGRLVLQARNPGSAEQLRVSVDYESCSDDQRFNLTVQRLDPTTQRIVDQEFVRDVSCDDAGARSLSDALQESRLLLLHGELPATRPLETPVDFISGAIGYVGMSRPGDDGNALSDYDLIGAERTATGLFSLDEVEHFDLLYACGAPERPVTGATFLVAAERFCAANNAMLIVDPPADCGDTAALLGWRRHRPLTSPHCLTYFPAIRRRDSSDRSIMPAAGALMGLLCRHDGRKHVFTSLADDLRQNSAALHRDWQAATDLQPDDAMALLRQGVNPLIPGTQGRLLFPGLVTSANSQDKVLGSLTQQRLAKFVLGQIERGTRWAVFATPSEEVWATLQTQVSDLLQALGERGAFKTTQTSRGWWVQCDARTQSGASSTDVTARLLVGFQAFDALQPTMFSVTISRSGVTVTRTILQGSGPQ